LSLKIARSWGEIQRAEWLLFQGVINREVRVDMTHRHLVHAKHIVSTFKEKLSKSGVDHVGDRHFDELELLIESAISTAVLEEVEHALDRVQEVVTSSRKDVEHV